MINLDAERETFLDSFPQYATFDNESNSRLMSDDGITAFIGFLSDKGILQVKDPGNDFVPKLNLTSKQETEVQKAFNASVALGAKVINEHDGEQ